MRGKERRREKCTQKVKRRETHAYYHYVKDNMRIISMGKLYYKIGFVRVAHPLMLLQDVVISRDIIGYSLK